MFICQMNVIDYPSAYIINCVAMTTIEVQTIAWLFTKATVGFSCGGEGDVTKCPQPIAWLFTKATVGFSCGGEGDVTKCPQPIAWLFTEGGRGRNERRIMMRRRR